MRYVQDVSRSVDIAEEEMLEPRVVIASELGLKGTGASQLTVMKMPDRPYKM